MRKRLAPPVSIVAALFLFSSPVFAAIQLTPIVTGLAEPLFVGHAGDGTGRLFIEFYSELGLQPNDLIPLPYPNVKP